MQIDVNVNFRAQPELIEALDGIGKYLQILAFIRENEKAESPEIVPESIEKANAGKTIDEPVKGPQTGTQEAEGPKAKQHAPEMGVTEPENFMTPGADPKAKVSGKELVGLRREVQGFCESGGRDKLSAWLKEHKLKKVPDCTNAQAAEMIAYIRKEGGKDA